VRQVVADPADEVQQGAPLRIEFFGEHEDLDGLGGADHRCQECGGADTGH
jgi:hypothetical protein